MQKSIRLSAAIPSSMLAFAAIAATIYPFIISTYYPGINFSDDSDSAFVYASTVPRLVMNTAVQSIKKGDIIRIIYSNGQIYDFEATARCSYVASIPCPLTNPQIKDSPTAPAKPTKAQIAEARKLLRDSCGKVKESIGIKTGYWSEEFEFPSNSNNLSSRINITATWNYTGKETVWIFNDRGGGCK